MVILSEHVSGERLLSLWYHPTVYARAHEIFGKYLLSLDL